MSDICRQHAAEPRHEKMCERLSHMSYNVLQCLTMSHNILQCLAMSHNVLQCLTMYHNNLTMSHNVLVRWQILFLLASKTQNPLKRIVQENN